MIFKRNKTADEVLNSNPAWKGFAGIAAGVVVVLMLGLAWYWSRSPDVFWVNEAPANRGTVVGYSTADTLVRVAETLLDKPGGDRKSVV